MLKLTMNPRKRNKRSRSDPDRRNRHQSSRYSRTDGRNMMIVDDDDNIVCRGNGSTQVAMRDERAVVREQTELLKSNIRALIKQERSGAYACIDYLAMKAWPKNVYDLLQRQLNHNAQGESRLDEYCREQIVEWSFRVVDYFRIDREVVAVSLNLLDRFLATCQCDRTTFKLAATTTLNLAVKLLHPCKLGELGVLSDLSRGEFDMKDVAEMESHVLRALKWNTHPPTTVAFATLILDYVFTDESINMSSTDIGDLYDITSFFTELAVCDYYFLSASPSQVALACVLNALEGMFGHDNSADQHFLRIVQLVGIYGQREMYAHRQRLWQLYERSEECALHNTYDPVEEDKSASSNSFIKHTSAVGTSPVGVTTAPRQPRNTVSPSNEFVCAMQQHQTSTVRNGSW